jgi:hypothetical protein
MPFQSRVRCCFRGRDPGCRRRRSISDHIGREKVGRCWLSPVRPHAVNHAAIHISKQPKPIISPQAAPSERAQKATPSTKLGAKVPQSYGLSAGPGGGDQRCPAPLHPKYSHHAVVLPGGLLNLGRGNSSEAFQPGGVLRFSSLERQFNNCSINRPAASAGLTF